MVTLSSRDFYFREIPLPVLSGAWAVAVGPCSVSNEKEDTDAAQILPCINFFHIIQLGIFCPPIQQQEAVPCPRLSFHPPTRQQRLLHETAS